MSRSGRSRRIEHLGSLTIEQAGEIGSWLPATCSGRRLLSAALDDWDRDIGRKPEGIDAVMRLLAWHVYELLELERTRRRQRRLALYDDHPDDDKPPAAGGSPPPDPARLEADQ